MLWTSEISAKVKEVFFQFKNQTGINEETIWRTAFQSYLYRTTFQSKIIVASADQKTGKWVAYVQEFSRDTRFVDQIDRDFSTASGDFPIQAAFYYGVEKKTKNINSNICLVVMLDKLILEFDSKFYSEGEVERISSGFIVFLENLADNFEQIIAKIPLLSPEQLHLQTVIWNKTELDYEKESTLPKIFEEMVRAETPNRNCCNFRKSLNYVS